MSKVEMPETIGWDIGGAHLKAVSLDREGNVMNVLQLPCELWRGLDKLEAAVLKILDVFKAKNSDTQHAVTMTGELVDLFQDRHTGVVEIAKLASKLLGKKTMFYAANSNFLALDSVPKHSAATASTNWYASASLLAKHVPDALMIDMGSTTTDIVPIIGGRVAAIGLTDSLRMREDTLVYTGVVRTPVMALGQKLLFEGAEINVAAEYFATMADVYRLTGDLPAAVDMADTADGKGKTVLESARRLARMIGHDVPSDAFENKSLETWQQLAFTCKFMQINQIKLAVLKHLKPRVPIIGAGAGAFLVEFLAKELEVPYMTTAEALQIDLDENLAVCFPAYAVAYLAWSQNVGSQ